MSCLRPEGLWLRRHLQQLMEYVGEEARALAKDRELRADLEQEGWVAALDLVGSEPCAPLMKVKEAMASAMLRFQYQEVLERVKIRRALRRYRQEAR